MLCLPSIRLASELIVHETCLMNSLYLRTERKTCRGSVCFVLLYFIERSSLFLYACKTSLDEGGGGTTFSAISLQYSHMTILSQIFRNGHSKRLNRMLCMTK